MFKYVEMSERGILTTYSALTRLSLIDRVLIQVESLHAYCKRDDFSGRAAGSEYKSARKWLQGLANLL